MTSDVVLVGEKEYSSVGSAARAAHSWRQLNKSYTGNDPLTIVREVDQSLVTVKFFRPANTARLPLPERLHYLIDFESAYVRGPFTLKDAKSHKKDSEQIVKRQL